MQATNIFVERELSWLYSSNKLIGENTPQRWRFPNVPPGKLVCSWGFKTGILNERHRDCVGHIV